MRLAVRTHRLPRTSYRRSISSSSVRAASIHRKGRRMLREHARFHATAACDWLVSFQFLHFLNIEPVVDRSISGEIQTDDFLLAGRIMILLRYFQ